MGTFSIAFWWYMSKPSWRAFINNSKVLWHVWMEDPLSLWLRLIQSTSTSPARLIFSDFGIMACSWLIGCLLNRFADFLLGQIHRVAWWKFWRSSFFFVPWIIWILLTTWLPDWIWKDPWGLCLKRESSSKNLLQFLPVHFYLWFLKLIRITWNGWTNVKVSDVRLCVLQNDEFRQLLRVSKFLRNPRVARLRKERKITDAISVTGQYRGQVWKTQGLPCGQCCEVHEGISENYLRRREELFPSARCTGNQRIPYRPQLPETDSTKSRSD